MRDDETSLARAAIRLEEYRALRATIRERGTLRLFVIAITFVAWAFAALLVLTVNDPGSLASLAALAPLVAGFEVAFAAHVGVERVGRFIQVHFEPDEAREPPCWEHAIMRFGQASGQPGGPSALASPLFIVAALLNLAVLVRGAATWPGAPDAAQLAGLAGATMLHVVFMLRVEQASTFASRQRQHDLDAFRKGRQASGG